MKSLKLLLIPVFIILLTLTVLCTDTPITPVIPDVSGDFVVFAWNDLGMHCLNPTYDKAVILPPYNTIWAQVIKRGNPPVVYTEGLIAEYKILNNTFSYGKRDYGQFWDYSRHLFDKRPWTEPQSSQ